MNCSLQPCPSVIKFIIAITGVLLSPLVLLLIIIGAPSPLSLLASLSCCIRIDICCSHVANVIVIYYCVLSSSCLRLVLALSSPCLLTWSRTRALIRQRTNNYANIIILPFAPKILADNNIIRYLLLAAWLLISPFVWANSSSRWCCKKR